MQAFARRRAALAAVAFLTFVAAADGIAAKKSNTDRYLHAEYERFQVHSIALLPIATFEPNDEAVRISRRALERALQPTGYRFISTETFRSATRASGIDSSLRALENSWRHGRLDSTALRAVGRAGIADAVLAVHVPQWEKFVIDYNVTGQSFTQIGWTLAMYSTATGERLWSSSFTEKGEGPYNSGGGGENVMGVQSSGLTNQARTSTSLEPPSFEEVATKLEAKLRTAFPPLPRAQAAADSAATGGGSVPIK